MELFSRVPQSQGQSQDLDTKLAMPDPWGNTSGCHTLYDSPCNTHTFGVLIWDSRTSGVRGPVLPTQASVYHLDTASYCCLA